MLPFEDFLSPPQKKRLAPNIIDRWLFKFLILGFVDIQLVNKRWISKNIDIWVGLKMWKFDIWSWYLILFFLKIQYSYLIDPKKRLYVYVPWSKNDHHFFCDAWLEKLKDKDLEICIVNLSFSLSHYHLHDRGKNSRKRRFINLKNRLVTLI
jgi:hypothetical protein